MNWLNKWLAATFLSAAMFFAGAAQAMSVKDFNAKPHREQSSYIVGFIEKMTADLGTNNPQLAKDIRAWFFLEKKGQPVSEGVDSFAFELYTVNLLAKQGKADLSTIQVEGVVFKVVKDKFPPQAAPSPSQAQLAAIANLTDSERKKLTEQLDHEISSVKTLLDNPSVDIFDTWSPTEQAAYTSRLVEQQTANIQDAQKTASTRKMLTDSIDARLREIRGLAREGKTDLSKMRIRDTMFDAMLARIDEEQQLAEKRLQEIDDRTIRLHDGRRVYVVPK